MSRDGQANLVTRLGSVALNLPPAFLVTDGMRPKRFAVWIFYELPHLNSSVLEASLYACDVNGSCNSAFPRR
ncbi:MAG: hypothetical protein ABW135_03940 [Thermoleophilaceae bacterium]